ELVSRYDGIEGLLASGRLRDSEREYLDRARRGVPPVADLPIGLPPGRREHYPADPERVGHLAGRYGFTGGFWPAPPRAAPPGRRLGAAPPSAAAAGQLTRSVVARAKSPLWLPGQPHRHPARAEMCSTGTAGPHRDRPGTGRPSRLV